MRIEHFPLHTSAICHKRKPRREPLDDRGQLARLENEYEVEVDGNEIHSFVYEIVVVVLCKTVPVPWSVWLIEELHIEIQSVQTEHSKRA